MIYWEALTAIAQHLRFPISFVYSSFIVKKKIIKTKWGKNERDLFLIEITQAFGKQNTNSNKKTFWPPSRKNFLPARVAL